MHDAVIVSAARTPIGTFGKAFVDVPAAQLGSVGARCALQRSEVEPQVVERVVFGMRWAMGS